MDFLSSASENLASPVSGETLNFTQPVCGLPAVIFPRPVCIICLCLKKAKQRPDIKAQRGGKFVGLVTCATGSVTEECLTAERD